MNTLGLEYQLGVEATRIQLSAAEPLRYAVLMPWRTHRLRHLTKQLRARGIIVHAIQVRLAGSLPLHRVISRTTRKGVRV